MVFLDPDHIDLALAELELYARKLDEERSRISQFETAEERGEARGEQKKALEIAQHLLLLNMLDVKAIAQATGLTVNQVEQLKSGAK